MSDRAAAAIALEKRFGANNYKPLDIVIERGEGVWVWDVEGRRYLDCLAAYSAVNQGHCHPRIVAALSEQAARLSLTSRAFRNDQLGAFYEELIAVLRPAMPKAERVLPMNSGAEAVESALKLARKWGYERHGIPAGQAEIVVCAENFHGRTIAIVGFSTDPGSNGNFGPFPAGFRTVPYGDASAMAAAIGPNTAAVLVEPIQGEAGVIIPPPGWLAEIRRLCDAAGCLLILDEIQTGLGRTGRWLAAEHEGVGADLTLLGKALGGGLYPVSAVVGRADVIEVLTPGTHGSTFGGNPLACAVARASLAVLRDEQMIGRADAQGRRVMAALEAAALPGVVAIRGRGLMIALDLDARAGGARRYCEALAAAGLLCKETHDHTIRLAPPLVLSDEEADAMVATLARVFAELA